MRSTIKWGNRNFKLLLVLLLSVILFLTFLEPVVSLTIGGTSGGYFNGTLDEVAIYGRALSSAEAINHYKRGMAQIKVDVRFSNDTEVWANWINYLNNPSGIVSYSANYSQYRINLTTYNSSLTPEIFRFTLSYSEEISSSFTINSVNITPKNPNRNSQLNCSVNVSSDNTFDVDFLWYVNDKKNITWNSTVSCAANSVCYTSINVSNLTYGESYICSARAYDGSSSTPWQNSSEVVVNNSLPNVTLFKPVNGNLTLFNRTPTLYWNSSDSDGDNLTYELRLRCMAADCGGFLDDLIVNITSTSYTPSDLLQVDVPYNWSVRAYDGLNWTPYTAEWNFTIESALIVNIVSNLTDFGSLSAGSTANTNDTGDTIYPFTVRNDGNIFIDLVIKALDPLFSQAKLNTSYFQFKASNSSESNNAYDYSTSQITWANVTSYNVTLVNSLNFSDSSDEVDVDFRITVPDDEPSGYKDSVIRISGKKS